MQIARNVSAITCLLQILIGTDDCTCGFGYSTDAIVVGLVSYIDKRNWQHALVRAACPELLWFDIDTILRLGLRPSSRFQEMYPGQRMEFFRHLSRRLFP